MKAGIRELKGEVLSRLAALGVRVKALEPMGLAVWGLNMKKPSNRIEEVINLLEPEIAERGFVVFKEQGIMSGEEQVWASALFGGKEIHSTHGVHPEAPNRHIFRVSNDPRHGILGVGPQWHNDGWFLNGIFSHVGYHIIRVPERGGPTTFAHQGIAFDALDISEQEYWQSLVSITANSGVLHPLVYTHPISKRKTVALHLGMTGGVFEVMNDKKRLLTPDELTDLCKRYNTLLNDGYRAGYTMDYEYEPGDFIVIDNLAIAHRASPRAHTSSQAQGLRILHRSTVKAMIHLDPLPSHSLPSTLNIFGPNPLNADGVWQPGPVGFRWDNSIHMQN